VLQRASWKVLLPKYESIAYSLFTKSSNKNYF
jgi:hypothetical protein